jgi:hypothetical protein
LYRIDGGCRHSSSSQIRPIRLPVPIRPLRLSIHPTGFTGSISFATEIWVSGVRH